MESNTLCNDCKEPVIFIENRKKPLPVKCDITPHTAYTKSGREVEVYLKHECNKGNNDKTPS